MSQPTLPVDELPDIIAVLTLETPDGRRWHAAAQIGPLVAEGETAASARLADLDAVKLISIKVVVP